MKYLSIKSIMGYCLILLVTICLSLNLSAQTFKYTYSYDANGNRTTRVCIEIGGSKSAELDKNGQIKGNTPREEYRETIAGYGLLFYPNPTDGQLVIELENTDSEIKLGIKVIDVNGRLVYTTEALTSHTLVDLSDQAEGSYVLQITINSETKSFRIIKK